MRLAPPAGSCARSPRRAYRRGFWQRGPAAIERAPTARTFGSIMIPTSKGESNLKPRSPLLLVQFEGKAPLGGRHWHAPCR